jgi:hypothetical protein
MVHNFLMLFKINSFRGVAQAVEHLLCTCEALSSDPSPTKINSFSVCWYTEKQLAFVY